MAVTTRDADSCVRIGARPEAWRRLKFTARAIAGFLRGIFQVKGAIYLEKLRGQCHSFRFRVQPTRSRKSCEPKNIRVHGSWRGERQRSCRCSRRRGCVTQATQHPISAIRGGGDGTMIVGAGVDSLYLSVRGTLKPGVQSLLERLKTQKRSRRIQSFGRSRNIPVTTGFEVSDKGARLFSWHTGSSVSNPISPCFGHTAVTHVQIPQRWLSRPGVTGACLICCWCWVIWVKFRGSPL